MAANGSSVIVAGRAGGSFDSIALLLFEFNMFKIALANYPHARVFGGLVYVSGISSRRADGSWDVFFSSILLRVRKVVENEDGSFTLDICQQTKAVIENIKVVLEAAGSGLDKLIDLTVFLVDMKDYEGMNK
ncbi:hypothetical protein HK096_007634, partial [Nowakowskiella sp. JEL0078]